MDNKNRNSSFDRLQDAGLNPDWLDQTAEVFDQWRQKLAAVNDADLGQDDLNTLYQRFAQDRD